MDEDRARDRRSSCCAAGTLAARASVTTARSTPSTAAFGEWHLRIPLKGGFLLSHRLRADLRWLGKDSHEFSNRWRYRADAGEGVRRGAVAPFVPYMNVEPYTDSRYDTVNRVRLIAGTSASWSSRAAVETNVTYQYQLAFVHEGDPRARRHPARVLRRQPNAIVLRLGGPPG